MTTTDHVDTIHDRWLAAAGVLSAMTGWCCEGQRDGVDQADRASAELVARFGAANGPSAVAFLAIKMLNRVLWVNDDPGAAGERIHALLVDEVGKLEHHRTAAGRRERYIDEGRMHRACAGCQMDVFDFDLEDVLVESRRLSEPEGRCCWCGRSTSEWGWYWPRWPHGPHNEDINHPEHCDGDHREDDKDR